MIVITLTKVPLSLRGDLTKWCQEVQTGVYVGSFSARIRDLLWERIMETVKNGEATMIYSTNNELGYAFRTNRKDKEIVFYDGLPLLKHLTPKKTKKDTEQRHGFSKAATYRRANYARKKLVDNLVEDSKKKATDFNKIVAIDLETSGLNTDRDAILSIGAVKADSAGKESVFSEYINYEAPLSDEVRNLTGLSTEFLREHGVDLKEALLKLDSFIEDVDIIVGYNLRFDLEFLRMSYLQEKILMFQKQTKDLLKVVKKKNKFMKSYHLEDALEKYDVINEDPHTAIGDAKATFELTKALLECGDLKL